MMMMIMEGLSDDPAISSSTPTKLPGFRFHPTEEELLSFYLKTMVFGNKFLPNNIIGFLNIYNYDPSDLPRLAKIGEREWYFFVPRDRKHGSGGRPNRTTQTGFWKATGSDRKIITTSDPKRVLGLKKTLVFYQGRAPHGSKTNWVMNEYRLPDKSTPKQDIVLCKIYMKATSLKVLEQRAAMEEDNLVMRTSPSPSPSFCNQQTSDSSYWYDTNNSKKGLILKKEMSYEEDEGALAMMMRNNNNNHEEEEGEEEEEEESRKRRTCLVVPGGKSNLTDLQLPNLNTDWTQDSFWTQLSPWLLDHLTPSLLNY